MALCRLFLSPVHLQDLRFRAYSARLARVFVLLCLLLFCSILKEPVSSSGNNLFCFFDLSRTPKIRLCLRAFAQSSFLHPRLAFCRVVSHAPNCSTPSHKLIIQARDTSSWILLYYFFCCKIPFAVNITFTGWGICTAGGRPLPVGYSSHPAPVRREQNLPRAGRPGCTTSEDRGGREPDRSNLVPVLSRNKPS